MNSVPDIGGEMEIELEPLRLDHAEGMFEGLGDPAGYVFLPDDPPTDAVALRAIYFRQIVGHSRDGSERWLNWVARRPSGGALVGYTQATVRDRIAQIAYHIFPSYWGQGLGTVAVQMMLRILDERGLVDEARALVDTRNEASLALLRKLGFTRLRTIVEADHFKDGSSDEHELAIAIGRTPRRR